MDDKVRLYELMAISAMTESFKAAEKTKSETNKRILRIYNRQALNWARRAEELFTTAKLYKI